MNLFSWRRQLLLVEGIHTNRATPIAFRCLLHWRDKAVHMVAAVAIVTEKELVVVLGGAAKGASLALNALPGVLLHADLHVVRELQAGWVACPSTHRAANQLFGRAGLFVVVLVPEAEVAVSSWLGLNKMITRGQGFDVKKHHAHVITMALNDRLQCE